MKLNRVLSFILAVAMVVSFVPGGIFSEDAQAVAAGADYEEGYTWAFDQTVALGNTKGLVSGDAAGTVKIMNHEGNGNALTPDRAIADGVLTTEVVKNWGNTVGHGVFYQLPAALEAGKVYELSLNLYGGNDAAAMNGIAVSFGDYTDILTGSGGTIQEWRSSYLDAMHKADAKITRSISGNLPTEAGNTVQIEFIATEAMTTGGWMMVTFPLALNGSYKLGNVSIREVTSVDGYTWKFDKTVEAFGTTNEFKTVYYGNEANTVGIVSHEGYGSGWGSNTSRSLKNGLLTSVITAGWEEEGHGVYYKLPAELVVGKIYQVSMNLYAAEENTPMTNDNSSSITVSFNNEVNGLQEWRISQMEGYHNAGAKFSVPAPTSLSTQSDNVVSFEFVATQEMVDGGSWMLITFPMEDGKTYILGDTSIKTVSYNYADGHTWQMDNTIAFTTDNAHKVMQYGNKANTVGIISHSAYANYGTRSLSNGILTTNITSSWAKGANGLYYKLPIGLTAGQEYVVSMNLYASAEGTALVNDDSTSIKLSFSNEIPTEVTGKVDQYWTAAQIEGIHNAETLLTYRAPDYLSTDTENKVAISFVATQAMVDNDGWMLISMPLAVNGEVNLGAVTLKEKNTDNHFLNGDFSDGLTGWMTNNDSSYVSVQDSVLNVSDKVPAGDVKLYQTMYLEAGVYRLSFDVLGAPASWRPVYFMGTALDNSSVTGSQLQVSKESGITADGWWTVTRDVTIETAGTYYFQMNLNQVSSGASVAPKMQYDNFAVCKGLKVTADLSNAKLSADIKVAIPGQSYANTVTANAGYKISKVTVTMGGTEVADAYNAETGKISIAAVTGELHIQVETIEDETANLMLNGNFEQGNTGWANNGLAPEATIADGVLTLSAEKTASGDARTYNLMQLKPGAYQLSFDVKGTPHQYRPLISVSKNYWTNDYGQYFMYDYNLSDTDWTTVTESFIVPDSAADAGTGLAPVYVTIWSSNGTVAPVTEMQFDNFTVHKGLKVTADLSNAQLNADIKAVVSGQSYVNTVLANPGYKLSKVTVTMGGKEVTDAYNAETGKISIAAVTGELHIQVETVEDPTVNLMLNGDFEQGNTGWAKNDVTPAATIADGVLTLSAEKTASGDARTYNLMQLKPGAYQLSFDVKGTPHQYRPLISVSKNYWTNDYGQYFMYDYNLSDAEWTTVTESFIVPDSAADTNTGLAPVYVTIWSSNGTVAPVTEMQFDNFTVHKGLKVTADLSNAQLSADIKAVVPGQSYVNTVLANPGYKLSKVTVTMGGAEVADAYNAETGKISIAAVTGELHIQVETVEDSTANLMLNGNFEQGNTGWKNNGLAPVATIADGVLTLSAEKTASGDARTYNLMQLKPGAYQLSFDVKGTPHQYRPLISVSKNYWTNDYGQYFMYDYNLSDAEWTTVTESFIVPDSAADADTGLAPVYVTIWSSNGTVAPVTEMQFDNFTVYKGLKVTADLSNAQLSADIKAVVPGQSYVNTVLANPGYKLSKVTVTMGGAEVADAYNAETGKISVAVVTAELHIQVETVEDPTANLLLNGDFEQGNTGWANNGLAPVATIADGVLILSTEKTASGDARTYYTTQLKPGNYKLSFKVKGTPHQYRPLISVSKNYWTNDYGQYFMYKYNLSNTAWTTVTEYFTVPESAADANTGLAPVCITIWNSNASYAPVTRMYFDDFELYKSAHAIVQKPEDNKVSKPAVIGSRPNASPYNDYPYICDEEHNLMPNFGFESEKNYLENTYSKIVADENAWEGNHSLHYAPVVAGNDAENLLKNGDFAKWDKSNKSISDWQFNNPSKLNKLEFVELDGRNAVKLLKCGENEDFNLEITQRVYLEADFTYTFSFDFYGVAHWGPNLVIYDDNMEHISTMNAKTSGTEGQWTTLSTTYRPTESGYYVFAVRIHNAAYPQKEQYISNCSVTLKSTRVEYELADLKPDTNYWLTLFVKASEVASVETSFITFGMTVPETGNFLLMEDPSSEGGRPYKTGQQLVPMAYDGQWHILTVPFNTKELTKLNFTIDGLNCEVWFDNIYIFEEANAKTFKAPITAKDYAVVTDNDPELLGCEEDKNLFENYHLNDGSAFWGDDSHKFGVFGNTVNVADSGSRIYGNALHYASDRPNGTYYIKWIDVEPNTEYTFSAKYAIARPGDGFMGLINGYRMESEVTENRLFPTMIHQFDFGEENYLESLAWQTAAVSFNSGARNRIGFVICDAGGDAYVDELRLFKSSDGIALEDIEDTLPNSQDSVEPVQPQKPGVIAIVMWSLVGVLLAAATVSFIIIQKKSKNKQ